MTRYKKRRTGRDSLSRLGTTMAVLGIPLILYLALNLNSKLDGLEEKVQSASKIQTENVLRGNAPETFYVIEGDTTYLSIDGRPVPQYFTEDDRK